MLKDRMHKALAYRASIATKGESVTQLSLASAVGIKPPSVNGWFSGETKTLKGENLLKAAEYLQVDPKWLSAGIGKMLPGDTVTPMPEGAIYVGNERARPIYVVGKGAGNAAPERIWTDGDRPEDAIDDFVMGYSSDPEAFLIEVDGSSMYPKYEHGNFALIEPNTPIDLEDVVLVRQEDGRSLLKKLLSKRNGVIVLGSYNDPIKLELHEDEVSWMYYAANEIARKKIKTRF